MSDSVNPRATKKISKGPSGPLTKEETRKLKRFEKGLRKYSKKVKKEGDKKGAKEFRKMANTLTKGRLISSAKKALDEVDVDLKKSIRRHPWAIVATTALDPTPANVGEDAAVRKMHRDYKKMTPSVFKREYGRKTLGKTSPKKNKGGSVKKYANGGRVAKYKG